MPLTTQSFTGRTAVGIYTCIWALALGVGLSLLLIVPTLRANCVWFDTRCKCIDYQLGPNNMLLVTDDQSGFSYWFDGEQYIFAYGDNLTGICPSQTTANVTGVFEPVGDSISSDEACRSYNADGVCTELYSDPVCAVANVEQCVRCTDIDPDTGACLNYYTDPNCDSSTCLQYEQPASTEYTPQLQPGTAIGTSSLDLFVPVYALDASTMKLQSTPLCARPLSQLPTELTSAPHRQVKYKLPSSTNRNLDIYQIFEVLAENNVFKPPA